MTSMSADARLRPVCQRLERFVAEDAIGGFALAVARDQEILGEWYGGEAAPGSAARPETLWPLACISKLYTASVIMALVERGELTLSTLVREHLPDFSGQGREAVRLRQLLTHTSGLVKMAPERYEALMREKAPLSSHLAEAYEGPLLFPPGTGFSYTDSAFAIAAQLVERVTGKPFSELVRSLVFEPAGLEATYLAPPRAVYDRIAYVRGVPNEGLDGALFNSHHARQLAHPGCGAYASARDLLRLGLLFAPGSTARFLSGATIRTMTTDQTGGEVRGRVLDVYPRCSQRWGFGFTLRAQIGNGFEDAASAATYCMPGAAGSLVLIDPIARVTIAYASNRYIGAGLEPFLQRLSTVVGMALAALT